MSKFVELLAATIANAESRDELLASRARLVTASDATRRRIERDLHDGVQQRLIVLALELHAVQAAVPPDDDEVRERLARMEKDLSGALDDLREIAHGLYPAILSQGGLRAALNSLGRRSPLPVELEVHIGQRLAEPLEVAVYSVASEALTNTLKHAHATRAHIDVRTEGGDVSMWFHDDEVGGADLAGGSGLIGRRDRVEALGGEIKIGSPPGEGPARPGHDPRALPCRGVRTAGRATLGAGPPHRPRGLVGRPPSWSGSASSPACGPACHC